MGVPDDALTAMFEPCVRVSACESGVGFGLGLAIVAGRARLVLTSDTTDASQRYRVATPERRAS